MLEAEGQDVSYVTDVDVHEHPELLGNHHEVISGAHDEYYSRVMRNGLQTARDQRGQPRLPRRQRGLPSHPV